MRNENPTIAWRGPRVSVILVNWNGWADTLLCLQSVFGLDYPSLQVIVCDNGSTDESLLRIRAWARGELCAVVPSSHPARPFVMSARHPTSFAEYDGRRVVSADGDEDAELVLIATGANLGFAGGNNAGLRHVIAHGRSEYAWLLNNDTVVAPDALGALVDAVEDDDTRVLVSSRVMYMAQPERPWFEGGAFDPLTGTSHHVPLAAFGVSKHPYLCGCALMIGRGAWNAIGLLDDEAFFMYGEDADYSLRAREAGIPLRMAPRSTVLHAVSASSQLSSPFAYRHNVASGIRVAMRHFSRWRAIPISLFHVTKLVLLAAIKRPGRAALLGYGLGIMQGFRRSAARLR